MAAIRQSLSTGRDSVKHIVTRQRKRIQYGESEETRMLLCSYAQSVKERARADRCRVRAKRGTESYQCKRVCLVLY